jgi:hypothetical protein
VSILDSGSIPNPLPSDKSATAIIQRRLRRQIAVYEGTMKLPFVPGGIGGSPNVEGPTAAQKLNALVQYVIGGPNLLQFGFEFDVVIADIKAPVSSVDYEMLDSDQRRQVLFEERRRISELTTERCRKGL